MGLGPDSGASRADHGGSHDRPASIKVLALTHNHQDHVQGLLTPDGRVLFPNLKAIVIPEAAVESFFAEAHLAQFRPLLKPIRNGDQVAGRLRAVALPGHAPGHTGYAFDTDEDHFLFFGDIVHVPAVRHMRGRFRLIPAFRIPFQP